MFTGIVEELGRVRSIEPNADGARLVLEASLVLEDATLGASIAVNGVCLTVVDIGSGVWSVDAVTETLGRTTLGKLSPGDPVNLERPVRLADRLGGHLVQGHVDGVGTVASLDPMGDGSVYMRIRTPEALLRYIVEKGSITVDGVSLTVAGVDSESFSIALIPHTRAVTTLGTRQVGDAVNLEVDVTAKYVEKLLAGYLPEAQAKILSQRGT